MRHLTSFALAITLSGLVTLGLHAVTAARPSVRPAAAPRVTPPPEPCTITATHTAAPEVLDPGAEVTVTLHLAAKCKPPPQPLHIVLVVDPSEAMGDQRMRDLRTTTTKLVDRLELARYPNTKVAVVEVRTHTSRIPPGGSSEDARTLVPLTNAALRVKNALKRIRAEGRSQTELGIEEGVQILLRGRLGLPEPPYGYRANEVMIVFADGNSATGCDEVLDAARHAKSLGILMVTVSMCVNRNRDCDVACLRQAASSARYFFGVDDVSGIIATFERVRKDIVATTIRRATIIDLLPPSAELIADSAAPPALVEPLAEGTRLSWVQNFMPWDGITITYRARPGVAGLQPISLGATADVVDNADRHHLARFPIPSVEVRAPMPLTPDERHGTQASAPAMAR